MIARAACALMALLLPAVVAAQDVGGAIVTTRSAAPPMTTDEKITSFLAGARAEEPLADSAAPRRIHGEVGVTVGSDGYRGGDVRLVAPLGESGMLGLFYGRSQGGRGYGRGESWINGGPATPFDASREAPVGALTRPD